MSFARSPTGFQLHQVAVYGTLKRGGVNHAFLRGARYVGKARLTGIALYDLGAYPAARLEPSAGVQVEVYRVTGAGLRRLDRLEDYRPDDPGRGEYDRQQLTTPFGPAWVYLYNRRIQGRRRIVRGGWC
ncbi:gamma-glutamylcyclotransferase [Marinobacter halodurans]|uniref:Gamma-glutamylcyclotransferase n=1 Tax=Marinobacter halodurans TaxID=2528979 RepID=A0ABY1ZNI6_9GAMM|nr:gamma-glutamylcyclotransferase family protein [Marinobacter halodurans]TBW58092.1 gamma-glutamylcyclotransferase [Marinobacter halodurans]